MRRCTKPGSLCARSSGSEPDAAPGHVTAHPHEPRVLSYLTLLASVGTLVCCTLPALYRIRRGLCPGPGSLVARRLIRRLVLVAATLAAPASEGDAQSGHAPVYGLSTPTLPDRGWSVELTAMARLVGDRAATMFRPAVEYGITEDLQVSLSLPMPLYVEEGIRPVRMMGRMPATSDVEWTLAWRFHRQAPDVGARFESTAYLSFAYPTDAARAGVRTSPGFAAAVATGYASRSVYAWGGALYRRYMSPSGATADHLGDLAMYSLVAGYRPPFFRHDFPRPDWRLFVEAVGEYTEPDELAGQVVPNTGGHRLFVGPTLLGLYGAWGISGGPMFPVYHDLNGIGDRDRVRFVVNVSTWFE